jgi:hypothetical protein
VGAYDACETDDDVDDDTDNEADEAGKPKLFMDIPFRGDDEFEGCRVKEPRAMVGGMGGCCMGNVRNELEGDAAEEDEVECRIRGGGGGTKPAAPK